MGHPQYPEFDRLLDHARTVGALLTWGPLVSGRYFVRLNDKSAGSPEGYGSTLNDAAHSLWVGLEEQLRVSSQRLGVRS